MRVCIRSQVLYERTEYWVQQQHFNLAYQSKHSQVAFKCSKAGPQ